MPARGNTRIRRRADKCLRMNLDQRPPFSYADQPAAEGHAEVRRPSLLDLLPETEPGNRDDLATLMRDPQLATARRDPTPAGP